MKYRTCVGIDTHSTKNEVFALDTETGEAWRATLSADPRDLGRFLCSLPVDRGATTCVYEAGPTGFGLARSLGLAGWACVVAATSKLPQRTDAMKTDRVDAEWLARCLAAGAVRPVRVPTAAEESLAHLSRLRGECARERRAARQRVSSFLLLTGERYTPAKSLWTKTFGRWAEAHEFANPADTYVFRDLFREAEHQAARVAECEAEIERLVGGDPALSERVARLTCLPRVGRVTAFSLVCEVYDFSRFRNGAAFANWLGLTPSEHSTGKRRSRGGITKRGNAELRRLLVESSSAYSASSAPARVDASGVSEAVAEKARGCCARLRRRRLALRARGVEANKAKVAVARELAEWVYYITVM
jgi:transposase